MAVALFESIRPCFANGIKMGTSASTARVQIFAKQKLSSCTAAILIPFAMADSKQHSGLTRACVSKYVPQDLCLRLFYELLAYFYVAVSTTFPR